MLLYGHFWHREYLQGPPLFVKSRVNQVQHDSHSLVITRLFDHNIAWKMLYFSDFNMFGIRTQPNCILTKNMVDFGQNQAYLNTICSCIYRQKIQLLAKTYKDCLLWQHIVVIFKTFLY